MQQILVITEDLCQALKSNSQDIVNDICLVSSTKSLLQNLRDGGLDALLATMKLFCEKRSTKVPEMIACYVPRDARARHHQDEFQCEHYYRVDIFYAAIDSQILELNTRFNGASMEMITLSMTLDPQEHESFDIDKVRRLVDVFYPQYFKDQEKIQLKMQIAHYKLNLVLETPEFKSLKSISALCRWMVETRRSTTYHLAFQVIILVLTLPVSTASGERSFSAMKAIKTKLQNKIEDVFLSNSSLIYIENEISMSFCLDSVVDDFRYMKEHRVAM